MRLTSFFCFIFLLLLEDFDFLSTFVFKVQKWINGLREGNNHKLAKQRNKGVVGKCAL